jgi:ribosomal protein S6--L-glutamate ligase/gamma-F420-2:alpha-L-glutamate ligase
MKNCWIVVNGELDLPKFIELYDFIKIAAEKQCVSAHIVKNNELIACIDQSGLSLRTNYTVPDFVIFMDKDIHLAEYLEIKGIPVFNSSKAIEICDNKIRTHLALSKADLPAPKTFFSPFLFDGMTQQNEDFFRGISVELGFPLVVKEARGSFGNQVYLMQNLPEFLQKVEELGHTPFLMQEFVSTSSGRDIRLNVVGENVVAAMLRESQNDFRANASQGGKLSPYSPTHTEIDLAIAAAKAVGADFAGVDLLFGETGPLICEVNSNAHLLSIYHTTAINVADSMIKYCLSMCCNKDITCSQIMDENEDFTC